MITIIGVLSAVAIPRFANSLARQKLDAAQRRIELDLAQTQQLARFTGTAQKIVFDLIGNTYGIDALADPDRVGQVYTVQLGKEPYEVTLAVADFAGSPFLVYDAFGTPQQDGYVAIFVGDRSRIVKIGTPVLPATIMPPVK